MTNLRSCQQPTTNSRSYRTSGILFPSPQIAAPQLNHPGGLSLFPPSRLSSGAHRGKPTPILTLNRSSLLPSTGLLSSPTLFVFLPFSLTSFLLRHYIHSPSVNTCRVKNWRRQYLRRSRYIYTWERRFSAGYLLFTDFSTFLLFYFSLLVLSLRWSSCWTWPYGAVLV